ESLTPASSASVADRFHTRWSIVRLDAGGCVRRRRGGCRAARRDTLTEAGGCVMAKRASIVALVVFMCVAYLPAQTTSWRPTIVLYQSKGGIPDDGPLTIAVPAAVAGAAYAVQKYGTKPLADIFAPAIEIAEQGFPITEALAQGLKSGRDKLAKFPSSTKIWF